MNSNIPPISPENATIVARADERPPYEQNGADNDKPPPKEFYLAWYKEHADQARQHENQRERMTTLLVAIAGGGLGLATLKADLVTPGLLGVMLIILGLFGAFFSYRHYEKNRLHVTIISRINGEVKRLFNADYGAIRDSAESEHSGTWPILGAPKSSYGRDGKQSCPCDCCVVFLRCICERLRLHHLWVIMPLLVALLGIMLVCFHKTSPRIP